MSKTIESLKRIPAKEGALHEHIARTYFYQKTHTKKHISLPNKLRIAFVALSAVSLIAISITALAFFRSNYEKFVRDKTARAKVVPIFEKGRLNKDIVKSLEFTSSAKERGRLVDKTIAIDNSKKGGWADLLIDFKFPVDFSARNIILSARGKIGGERVNIVLRDVDNRSYRLRDMYLSANWKTETASLNDMRKNIDLSRITHLRLECGYTGESEKNTDSPVGLTVYFKTIQVIKGG